MKTIEQLQEENAALAAQVEAFTKVISERFICKELQPDGTVITDGAPWALQLLAATPQHHLRELRAEAVLEFKNTAINTLEKTVLVAHSGCRGTDASDLDDMKVIDTAEFIQFTNQYADQLRRGEVE